MTAHCKMMTMQNSLGTTIIGNNQIPKPPTKFGFTGTSGGRNHERQSLKSIRIGSGLTFLGELSRAADGLAQACQGAACR